MFGPLSLVVEIAWDKKQHSFGRRESVSTYQLQCGSKSERQRRYSIKKLQSCALYSVLFDRGHWRKFFLMCYVFFFKSCVTMTTSSSVTHTCSRLLVGAITLSWSYHQKMLILHSVLYMVLPVYHHIMVKKSFFPFYKMHGWPFFFPSLSN